MSDLTIGAVMKVLGGEYIGGILGGIGRAARERDARLLVFRGTPGDVAAAPFAREVQGWIAVHSPVGLAALARLGLPLVTVPYHDPEVGCPSVVADNGQGIREAVRHLIVHGHRRIAFIGWLGHPAIAERCQGYRDALAESGLPCPPELIVGVEDGSIASGRSGAEQLLDGGALPCTAVVAATDRNAAGIMQALEAAGLRVPVDVAVVGFDDMAFAQLADPPLTTLRTRFDELGRQAATLLLDEIGGIAAPRAVHRVPVTLIRRRSCGCDMAADLGPRPDAAAMAKFENGALAGQLVRMALFPVPPEPGRTPAEIWPGVETLIGGIDAALAGDPEPDPAALSQAWKEAVRLTPDLDMLRAMSALLSRAGAQRLAATPPDPGRAQRLTAYLARSEHELARARLAYHYEGMAHLEELAQNAPTVAMVVLSGKTGQAQQLDWLRLTPAHWGCLALYDDATGAPTSTLTVAGTYRRSGPPVPDRGTHFVAGAFPPAEWYPAPGTAVDTDVLMLMPIVSASRDWGVLALRGPIDAHGGYTPQRPNNTAMWGALLASALERDALAAQLAELANEDRKRAQETLRESQAYLAEAQRLSHTGSWAFDVASDKYVYASEECGRIFEFDAREDLPTREAVSRLIHPEDWDRVNEGFEKSLRDKVDTASEFRITLPSGTVKHVQAIRHPVLNAAGDVVKLVGTVIDATERKRAEEERERLRQLEADLAHINRVSVLGELAVSIAHEVGQPLAGVVNNGGACLRWLAQEVPNLEEAREAVKRIVRDGKRAGDIIARIRALTKRTTAPAEQLDLNDTIREVLALVMDEARGHNVIIRTHFAAALAPVAGDRVQLQQVVLNLVVNGIEAMSTVDGRPRELVLTTRNLEPDRVQVTVEDSGTGLDPSRIDKIFDPFYTTKPTGMGMGLAICRSILQSHGGRLWALPKDGPGTMFYFTVPSYQKEN
jgi:PAS domain S-box-containing protein